jgi:hypothetical protein
VQPAASWLIPPLFLKILDGSSEAGADMEFFVDSFAIGAHGGEIHAADSTLRRTPLLFNWQFPLPGVHWTLTNQSVRPAGRTKKAAGI